MTTKVVNLHHKVPYDVYIGRPGKGKDGPYGNPYSVADHGSNALPLFRKYFYNRIDMDPGFRVKVLELKDKTLGCFCHPKPCHGDIIAEWLDSLKEAI